MGDLYKKAIERFFCYKGPNLKCVSCIMREGNCLDCGVYYLNGEKIIYLPDYGAKTFSQQRFIHHILKQRVVAFFHNDKLVVPSGQGRSVGLAVGLQWLAWQAQDDFYKDRAESVGHE